MFLNEKILNDIIKDSFYNTKDFELFVPDILSKIKTNYPSPLRIESDDFKLIIKVFYQWNIFNIRNSVRDISKELSYSRVTVYSRIKDLINDKEYCVNS
jgi:predicted transcriptional regulator YheO